MSASKIDCLKYFYNLFYKNKIKIYPKDIILRMNSLGFAIWYADDGTTILVQSSKYGARSRRVQICTDCFTVQEHNNIKSNLESLGYQIKLIKRTNLTYRIQINKNKDLFLYYISDYFYYY